MLQSIFSGNLKITNPSSAVVFFAHLSFIVGAGQSEPILVSSDMPWTISSWRDTWTIASSNIKGFDLLSQNKAKKEGARVFRWWPKLLELHLAAPRFLSSLWTMNWILCFQRIFTLYAPFLLTALTYTKEEEHNVFAKRYFLGDHRGYIVSFVNLFSITQSKVYIQHNAAEANVTIRFLCSRSGCVQLP